MRKLATAFITMFIFNNHANANVKSVTCQQKIVPIALHAEIQFSPRVSLELNHDNTYNLYLEYKDYRVNDVDIYKKMISKNLSCNFSTDVKFVYDCKAGIDYLASYVERRIMLINGRESISDKVVFTSNSFILRDLITQGIPEIQRRFEFQASDCHMTMLK